MDQHLLITDVNIGWPGCTHDARVLRISALYREAQAGRFDQGKFIIGDAAYPLSTWLVTAFRDNGHLTAQQRQFNRVVCSIRQAVERAIGHIKGRFRKLKEVHLYNIQVICQVIFAGCILHNLCVLEDDDLEDYIDVNLHDRPNQYPPVFNNDIAGIAQRNQLLQLF